MEKWWEHSLNAKQRAYHQFFDEILRYDFRLFHSDLEQLLGHPVWTHQLGSIVWERLKPEVIRAYEAAGYKDASA